VRVIAVNLRAGGNATTIHPLIGRCERHEPDAIVLSEFRDTQAGDKIRAELRRLGFEYQAATIGHRGNGVLIAAVRPFEARRNPFGLPDDEYPHAILQATFDNLHVYGVYLPGQDRKRPHLRCLIADAETSVRRKILCIGDFNSGRNETDIERNLRAGMLIDAFSTADLYRELERHWTDAWSYLHPECYEFSWYPFRNDPHRTSRNGWRIDKAFVSGDLLPSLRMAEYDHRFRLDRLSDHSGLVVTFDDSIFPTSASLDMPITT
jgi:exonuclease III